MLTSNVYTRASYPPPRFARTGKPSLNLTPSVSQIAYIITNDETLTTELVRLVEASSIHLKCFSSLAAYLEYKRPNVASCLIVSGGLSDASLWDTVDLKTDAAVPPIILLSDAGDIPSCVRAIRKGAYDFLTLPLLSTHLHEALISALKKDEEAIALRKECESLRMRWRSLTLREAEIMRYVVDGFLNKQTAAELCITENTVQVHRGRVMRKMGADSFAALVRMSLKLADWGENALLHGAKEGTSFPNAPSYGDPAKFSAA